MSNNGRAALPLLGPGTQRPSTRSRWKTLPPDILQQGCRRVRTMSLAVAGIWTIVLLMNDVVAPLLGHEHTEGPAMAWPMPGNLIAPLGLVLALGTFALARRFCSRPKLVLDIALAFQVATAALVAILTNWHPNFDTGRISWLCLVILVQPAIVPSPPLATLVVSFVIATLDPLALGIAYLRGVPLGSDAFLILWYVVPNYISVGLALLPATIIAGLGREVRQARELGSYQLGELLGRGGMGEVYRAHHRMLARPAAIKLIRPEALGAGDPITTEVQIQRFRREAQAAALLRSPHTISLYDFGVTDEGTFYYVMELLEGFDLDTLVRRFGPVPPERAIFILRSVCRSLGEAHARGLIHRDIKPSNIFTCRLGLNVDFVKVLDFGLVKHERREAHHETSALLTHPDITTGTPAFMAPEMALGENPIDRRVDIYALGCVGYWLLTGRLVFEAETAVKTMLRHIQSEPAPPSRFSELEIPPELDQVILDCLAKKPDERIPDATTLSCRLASIKVAEPWTSERAEPWWQTHMPAPVPATDLRSATPLATVHTVK